MRIHYDPDSDSLYIGLSSNSSSAESEEVAPGVVLDFDEKNQIVGIEIDHASQIVDLNRLEADFLLKSNKMSA
jgi:uncharacterized protein YuzE